MKQTIIQVMQTQFRVGKKLTPKTVPKREYFWSPERRRYVRFPSAWRIRLAELGDKPSFLRLGRCKNLSQGGMKISCLEPFKPGAIVVLEADLNLLARHIRVNHLLQVAENRILAQVCRRSLNLETRLFEAGLEFIQTNKTKEFETFVTRAGAIP